VSLLWQSQLGLLATKVAFRSRDRHAFPGARSNQVGLELGNHREHVEQHATDRIFRVMD
jgi:hypothetical protein